MSQGFINHLAHTILSKRRDRIEKSGVLCFPTEIKTRPCILVVDDEYLIRESVKRILESESYIVVTAAEGAELVDIVNKIPIDLIILDVHLPWVNGIELCKLLRDPRFKMSNIPLLFLSGNNEQEVKKLAFDSGCDDYLVKPVDPSYLINTIKTLIKISQPFIQTYS